MFDRSYLQSPFREYLNWIVTKIKYQSKYKYLRVGYMSKLFNTTFGKYNWTGSNVLMINSSIGDFSYISDGSVINETIMGKFCSIGPNVRTAPGKHPTHTFVSTHPAIYSNPECCLKNFQTKDQHNPTRNVVIGNDVWLCANAVIADGVKIGDGAIIAANAVVTADVEPYSIMGGIPAKFIRKRFKDEQIDILNESKWWDKNIDWIDENAQLFLNIEDYCHFHKK
ncbi:CatB-related O-acetyltransferase [Chryseobacterium balustinum]|uniref:Acetyltransferase (Isoleucine patch superfamily) n=1 Tax=Chryseobacterium balustinum TaxID=246 RepID=A0AAX2IRC7_9FLAO|nr:CatB-related O-acetyltransferase [Chryseobacterium balustinum]AZB28258.1 antibiotic acetyltransferase [Chryseobacterium balustinum]SKB90108.1 Acetyltransferase (isoleucine patch superfamily) [Chryseobacterium balustinum]SQA92310.1 Streptogramin A acetyltransferase [Chryseobacterium balustinum]